MKIYLAAAYGRRKELLVHVPRIQQAGHEVTASWLFTDHDTEDDGVTIKDTPLTRLHASIDLKDVCRSDAVLNFTDGKLARGGRHVELGLALGMDKLCLLVGPVENIFHLLPTVVKVESVEKALQWIATYQLLTKSNVNELIRRLEEEEAEPWVI